LQAGGRRFDPDWLHQPANALERYNQFIDQDFAPGLLFKNPEVLF